MSFEVPVPVTAALLGVAVGFFLNYARDVLQTKTARKRLAVALLSESIALKDRYNEVFGDYIRGLPVGRPLDRFGMARSQNFFAIYDGNTGNLGLFPSSDLTRIIRAYTLAKGHLESINNATEVKDRLQGQITTLASTRHVGAGQLQHALQATMVDIANRLRNESVKVLSAAEEAIKSLSVYAK